MQLMRPPETVYVSFTAEIQPATAEALISVLGQQASNGVKHVHLMLSSPGGAVMSGFTIYNAIRGMPFRLTTHNIGNVDSICNVVFLAGEERFVCKHSTFMFHGVGIQTTGPMRLDLRQLSESIGQVKADDQRVANLFAERTDMSARDVLRLFTKARTENADFALTHGFATAIREVEIPEGAPIISFAFNR
jgi:ATP-dependent protease ClpP protease subunit